MTGDAEMPARYLHELRVALRRPYGGEAPDGPEPETDQPDAQAKAEPASAPLRIAIERGEPPSRMCSVSAR